MAREILFKAKRLDNGEWVEGSLINAENYTCILDNNTDDMYYPHLDGDLGTIDGKATPIIPDTICQYTGLTDKNGNKIWENDILHCKNRPMVKKADFLTQVEWDSASKGFILQDTAHSFVGLDAINPNVQGIYEVVEHLGSIFDNPELLEGGA